MNEQVNDHDQASEEILTDMISDEALEVAARMESRAAYSDYAYYTAVPCCY